MEPTDSPIDLFFKSPSDFTGKSGVHSTLYLLRRDTSLCFGIDPNTGAKINFSAFFPGVMALLAGIDLVAKFNYGDAGSGVSDRFKRYVSEYIDDSFREEIYQLRNSLLHSFSLRGQDRQGKLYNFILTRGLDTLIKKTPDNSLVVDITKLSHKFEESIGMYKKKMLESEVLQALFLEMFEKYGIVPVR